MTTGSAVDTLRFMTKSADQPSTPMPAAATLVTATIAGRPVAFDPGWLFIAAGMAILVAAAVLPAQDDLHHARWLRDRARVIETHRLARIGLHEDYLEALKGQDPNLLLSLAEQQLNQIPVDRTPIAGSDGPLVQAAATVFPALEPDPSTLPKEHKVDSLLHRLVTGPTTRLWMVALATALVLIGLLPSGSSRQTHASTI